MTNPPRRLTSVPSQINQYIGGKPSKRDLIDFICPLALKSTTDVLTIKEPPRRLFLTLCYGASTAFAAAHYAQRERLHFKSPFASAHNRFICTVITNTIDIQLT